MRGKYNSAEINGIAPSTIHSNNPDRLSLCRGHDDNTTKDS